MTALEALEAEALADTLGIQLCGELVHINPAEQWPASAVRSIREGDFDTWAEKCLYGDDYKIWKRIDPTLAEVEEFFELYNEVAPISPKGSGNSRTRSSGTRPRSKRT